MIQKEKKIAVYNEVFEVIKLSGIFSRGKKYLIEDVNKQSYFYSYCYAVQFRFILVAYDMLLLCDASSLLQKFCVTR